ncbi:MAG: Wzz/FepE/Etk N-terminal domain-containing protein [Bacteroidales bacterium]|nr:Wzz/FepE/Etk N-terminal domain-containing protein [Bacteroidales bacterium]
MADKASKRDDFNSINFLLFLWKWRKVLIITVIVSGIAAAIFSGPAFITPLYKSEVILFPTSTNSVSKALMDETPGQKQDIMEFGEEAEAEQMLQILNSSVIRDKVIKKYDLMNHYDINPKSKYALTNLHKEYNSNITYKRTEFMGVQIKVMDKSPEIAANIANDIAEFLDSTKTAIQRQRSMQGFRIVEEEYKIMEEDIREAEDSLRKLRELGVHDYESQSEMINQQLAIEIALGRTANINRLKEQLDILAKYGGAYVSLRDALEHEKKNFAELKKSYKKAKVDAEAFISQKFVVDHAYVAEKKSYPVRWLIVVVSAFSAFVLAIIVLILIEQIKRISKLEDLTV